MAWWQILLLTLYAGYEILDELQIYSSLNTPVGAGLIAGLIMGDLKTGLIIGGAMQLTVLGVGTFGGASKIDATTGTVLATAFSVSIKGMSPQVAISSIAVPVAAIMVLGVGTVLIPWATIAFIERNMRLGFGLLILYGVIVIVRQFAEPKIVGGTLGIHPLLTLAAMYLGFRLFGVAGMIIGPILALLARAIATACRGAPEGSR